jgi:hypothetical protein
MGGGTGQAAEIARSADVKRHAVDAPLSKNHLRFFLLAARRSFWQILNNSSGSHSRTVASFAMISRPDSSRPFAVYSRLISRWNLQQATQIERTSVLWIADPLP